MKWILTFSTAAVNFVTIISLHHIHERKSRICKENFAKICSKGHVGFFSQKKKAISMQNFQRKLS